MTDPDSSTAKSNRTRERLLDAAAQVLAEKGFAGTRLSDIAERANVQAPAIYYYYPSREDLIEEVMFVGAAAMRAHLDEVLAGLPSDATPVERISAAVEAHLRHELEISDYAKSIIRNGNQLPEQVSKRALAEITHYNDIWRTLVTELDTAGQLRSGLEPSVARMIVLGALNWAAEWWKPERGSLEDVIRTAQSMVLHSLRP
ncbi:TetR/AcrR family transcriptional regulator [Pseudonocardia spinosispora]|uniref:TetR/AcrR family transcriptional regulator n=1 Tax=Pseudonocardia spinosispora TaxID=103441 RepID=UPI000406B1FF|nr:TetR/AcrR family transcriptional regulator [Pseudonocardia spinosispora]